MPATAADIPPELFDLILDFLNLNSYVSEDYQRQIASVSKQDLNMATLVCRHWAKLCRSKLFEEITLQRPADVSQLQALLESTGGLIASSIQSLYVPESSLGDDAKTKPFLHLLPPIYPLVPKALKTSIRLDGPINPKRGSFRSIHRPLPRTNPAFSTSLAHLHLNDIHLRNFIELMYVVGELPDLYRLVCTKITWDAPPAVMPARRVVPGTRLETVLASECTGNWAMVWLFVGYKRRDALFLSQQDIIVAGQLVQSIEAGVDQERFTHIEATFHGTVESDYIGVIVEYDLMFTGQEDFNDLSTALAPPLHLICRRSPDPTIGEISTLTLDFSKPGPYYEKTNEFTDWAPFVENVSGIHNLQKVVLGFSNKDRLAEFATDIANVVMTPLVDKRLLKYAVRGKRGLYWRRLTPSQDVIEGVNVDFLQEI